MVLESFLWHQAYENDLENASPAYAQMSTQFHAMFLFIYPACDQNTQILGLCANKYA